MRCHHIVALFLLIFGGSLKQKTQCLYAVPPWRYRPCNSDEHHLYHTRNCHTSFQKIAILAQTYGNCGAFSFLRGTGSPCGFHGGYRDGNFPIYLDHFNGSSPFLAGHAIC